MTTVRDLVSFAMREAGILGTGQTLLAEDMNTGYVLLNRMLAQWQKRRWLVPGLTEVSAFGNFQKSNKIGPGQTYNCARPDKILGGYFLQTTSPPQTTPVSYTLVPIWAYEDYIRLTLKTLQSFPQAFFYDGAFPNGNVFIWPVPTDQYEIHLLIKQPIGFTTGVGSGNITSGGIGYTNGAYEAVALTGGSGTGATADISINAGVVTSVGIVNIGDGYKINDVLSVLPASVGGTGAGFLYTVSNTASSLDSQFDMPPEYEEAIHYNLAMRIMSAYQLDVPVSTGGLAKVALNTIKNANAQVPTLVIPQVYSNNGLGGFNIFAPDVRP